MSKPILIMVCDNQETVDHARRYWESNDVQFQVYSPQQWREGLESSFFVQQLASGLPSLSPGSQYGSTPSNIVNMPSSTNADGSKVQKMEQLEAKAIEEAIHQFRGNLTEAARALGIGRATLYRKVKQYQIDPSQARKRRMGGLAA